ncbi:hypothetical protein SDC9_178736 [bioreactor metagenome]|uniref:Uncharacterized protein n=1 Tax=bioreactor metagenome TaxID=1076179 RepID=A0A645GYX6_9ZZZZ
MDLNVVPRLTALQHCIQSAAVQLQSVNRDQHITGGEPGLLRRAVFINGCDTCIAAGQLDADRWCCAGRVKRQIDPERLEQPGQRQIIGALYHLTQPARQSWPQVGSGKRFDRCKDTVFLNAGSSLAVTLPQQTHDIIQTATSGTFAAQLQIERQRNQRAFCVIADDGIG